MHHLKDLKTISDETKTTIQLMNILDKFKEDDLKKLGKETIPFLSSVSIYR